jgi:hypothetical protein
MSLVGDNTMEVKGSGQDVEAQKQQAKELNVADDSHDGPTKSIDVKQSEQMFHDMESRMASESGAG